MMLLRFFCILVFVFQLFNGYGQNRSELERKKNMLLKEIAETESVLSSIKQTKVESIEKLNLLDRKISLRNSLIANLSLEISGTDSKIAEFEKTTQSLGVDIHNIKVEYGRMIYLSYLNRARTNEFMFIMSSESLNQAYKRLKYIQQYTEYRKKQIAVINSVQTSLNNQIDELEAKRQEKLKLLASQEKETRNLKNEMEEKTKTVNVLKLKENELSKRLKSQSQKAERLAKEIDKIIKAEIANRSNTGKTTKKAFAEDNVVSNNFRDNMGKLPWPTEKGIVTRGFGRYRDPIYKNVEIDSQGIDISTMANSDVHAIFEGEVTDKFFISGYNYAVIINHGKFYTVYQNLVDVRVKKGDKVKLKQVIGKVATDADSKSSVLHVQIWEQRKPLDPEIWLSKN